MSVEIVSAGCNYSIKKLNRSYRGGKSTSILEIDGKTGAVTFTGSVKVNGVAVAGLASASADFTAGRDLIATRDVTAGRNAVVTGAVTSATLAVSTNKLRATAVGVAFYGATVAAQPSSTGTATGFTAGAGTPVLDDSTFTGAVGSTAYRLSDIVKHLKNLGLIAS